MKYENDEERKAARRVYQRAWKARKRREAGKPARLKYPELLGLEDKVYKRITQAMCRARKRGQDDRAVMMQRLAEIRRGEEPKVGRPALPVGEKEARKREYRKEYRERNREKVNAYNRAYYQTHKEAKAAANRAYTAKKRPKEVAEYPCATCRHFSGAKGYGGKHGVAQGWCMKRRAQRWKTDTCADHDYLREGRFEKVIGT